MKVLNFGSLNIDYSFEVDHLVKPGETESSSAFLVTCGGKGLNQSVALKRAGVDVYHAGAIGKKDGKLLIDALLKESIDISYVTKVNSNSGSAFIQVDKNGENCIVLNGGANKLIDEEMVDYVLSNFDKKDIIILQNEISSLPYIINKAHKKGMEIVFNPSPINPECLSYPLEKVSIFFVNKKEAEYLASSSTDVLENLKAKYPKSKFVITDGSKESIYLNGKEVMRQKSLCIKPVDTTGAGDTFLGYFLSSYIRGDKNPLYRASVASALACLKRGAKISIPRLGEVEEKILEIEEKN